MEQQSMTHVLWLGTTISLSVQLGELSVDLSSGLLLALTVALILRPSHLMFSVSKICSNFNLCVINKT